MPEPEAVDLDAITKNFRMTVASDLIESDKYSICMNHPIKGQLIYSSSQADGKALSANMSLYFNREVL